MKLLRISENELRVVLSKQDLSELDLTYGTIDYNTTKTRKAIWEIFDRARSQTGFDAAKSRLYVRMYPLSGGGCELYVSKITDSGTAGKSASRGTYRIAPIRSAYVFEDFDALYLACRAVGPQAESSLYADAAGRYILLMKRTGVPKLFEERMAEFSKCADSRYISAYASEHCTLLCADRAMEKILGEDSERKK